MGICRTADRLVPPWEGTVNMRRAGKAVLCLSLLVMGSVLFPLYAQADNTSQANSGAAPAASAAPDETQLLWRSGTDGTSPAAASQTIESFGIWDFLRMFLVLALVIGAAYGVLVLIRRNKAGPVKDTRLMRVLANQSLGTNKSLHLVAVQKEVFLVGSADNSVNLIARIDNPETCQELLLLAADESAPAKTSFTDLLGSVFSEGFSRNQGKARPAAPERQDGAGGPEAGNQDLPPETPDNRTAGPDLADQRERLRNL